MSKLAPSILAADVMNLGRDARMAVENGCDCLHLDIMDGVFVPNISFGPDVLKGLKREVKTDFDTHLMLRDPLKYVDVFAQYGSDGITVHVESEHFEESIARIRTLGKRVGASLKPATPLDDLRPYLDRLDLVLVMTVEPGFGGQKLMMDQLYKISGLRETGFRGVIEVDGGVTMENAPLLTKAGADLLVMGTAFFKAGNPAEVAKAVHAL